MSEMKEAMKLVSDISEMGAEIRGLRERLKDVTTDRGYWRDMALALRPQTQATGVVRPIEPWDCRCGSSQCAYCGDIQRRGAAPTTLKCDGNHGGPRCGDPECWNQ